MKTRTEVDKNNQENQEEIVKFKFELNTKFGEIPKVRRQTDFGPVRDKIVTFEKLNIDKKPEQEQVG